MQTVKHKFSRIVYSLRLVQISAGAFVVEGHSRETF